jgi:uncharacterized membrane protein YfcA
LPLPFEQIALLCTVAFAAGFVDAIVGGGGLLQTPAALVILRSFPLASAIGTIKIPSFSGTLFASFQYLKRVRIHYKLILLMCVLAFFSAYAGSLLLTRVDNHFMKPVLLVVLTVVAIYTYTRKNFGQHEEKDHSLKQQRVYGIVISVVIGFYDGFIGPGAGSFLILAFISVLGFDFLHASAHAKLVNLATNLGSIILFTLKGQIIWLVAFPMAVCNAAGGVLGARTAIARGNKFIRVFFLVIVTGTLLRFAWDVFLAR